MFDLSPVTHNKTIDFANHFKYLGTVTESNLAKLSEVILTSLAARKKKKARGRSLRSGHCFCDTEILLSLTGALGAHGLTRSAFGVWGWEKSFVHHRSKSETELASRECVSFFNHFCFFL